MNDAVERFRVVRDGANVQITAAVRPHDAKFTVLLFERPYNGEATAECVRKVLDDGLHDLMETVRRQAYNAGYADGRAKRKKMNCFSVCARVQEVVGWREA